MANSGYEDHSGGYQHGGYETHGTTHDLEGEVTYGQDGHEYSPPEEYQTEAQSPPEQAPPSSSHQQSHIVENVAVDSFVEYGGGNPGGNIATNPFHNVFSPFGRSNDGDKKEGRSDDDDVESRGGNLEPEGRAGDVELKPEGRTGDVELEDDGQKDQGQEDSKQ